MSVLILPSDCASLDIHVLQHQTDQDLKQINQSILALGLAQLLDTMPGLTGFVITASPLSSDQPNGFMRTFYPCWGAKPTSAVRDAFDDALHALEKRCLNSSEGSELQNLLDSDRSLPPIPTPYADLPEYYESFAHQLTWHRVDGPGAVFLQTVAPSVMARARQAVLAQRPVVTAQRRRHRA